MTEAKIHLTIADRVARIELASADTLNALSASLLRGLLDGLREVNAARDVRAVILTGQGRAFCAGADLKEVLALGNGTGGSGTADFLDLVAQVFGTLRNFPKPVIGGLNGITVAGGLELALCCDILIAAESARIGDAHANFGLVPGGGNAALLPARIGAGNAKYMLFTGDSFPASHWLRLGLLQEVVPDAALDDRLAELAADLARKSPLALSRMKAVANRAADLETDRALGHELDVLRDHLRSGDAAEGLRAFSEKRRPDFNGN